MNFLVLLSNKLSCDMSIPEMCGRNFPIIFTGNLSIH